MTSRFLLECLFNADTHIGTHAFNGMLLSIKYIHIKRLSKTTNNVKQFLLFPLGQDFETRSFYLDCHVLPTNGMNNFDLQMGRNFWNTCVHFIAGHFNPTAHTKVKRSGQRTGSRNDQLVFNRRDKYLYMYLNDSWTWLIRMAMKYQTVIPARFMFNRFDTASKTLKTSRV